jgi:hypothetical protein
VKNLCDEIWGRSDYTKFLDPAVITILITHQVPSQRLSPNVGIAERNFDARRSESESY